MTDEEQRLRDAAIDGIITLIEARLNATQFASYSEFEKAVHCVRDYRAKAAPEPVQLRCEPPKEFTHLPYHWVHRGDAQKPWIAEWLFAARQWLHADYDALRLIKQSPEGAATNMLVYHSPATPNRADIRREPTDESMATFLQSMGYRGKFGFERNLITAALDHFNAPPITPAQWERIRQLALTEAPQVFAQEARAILAAKP